MSNEQLAMSNDPQTRQMKDSRVEWIGEIPAQWDVSTINSLYTLRNQKVSDRDYLPLSVTMKGIVPQLETAAKTDAHDDRKLVKKGDFAINSRSDRRGSCGISNYDGSVSLINTVLTPRGEMHPVYYNWLFHSARFADEFYRWGHGIVDDLWTTRWQEMRNITIPVPKYAVQQTIADYLDRKCTQIDTLIANQQQQIEKLKAYKQSVITETVTKGLDPDVAMKDSGVEWIGGIPKNWIITKIKYATDVSRGLFNHRPRNDARFYNGTYPFIQTGDVARAIKYITEYSQTLNENGIKVSKQFPKGTLTMTIAANVGDVAIMGFDAYFPDSVVGFIPNSDCHGNYLYYIFRAMKDVFVNASIMNTQLNLNVERVKNLYIPFATTFSEQVQIADYLDEKCSQIDRLIAIKQQKIEKLQQYKKSLIYEYVTGKKEVI